jgi:hypothetical protein
MITITFSKTILLYVIIELVKFQDDLPFRGEQLDPAVVHPAHLQKSINLCEKITLLVTILEAFVEMTLEAPTM